MLLRIVTSGFLFVASSAAAQEEQEIVVTGRGLRTGVGEAVYDTVIIGRERLTGSASNRLEEILRDVPGFQLFRRSDARSANPTSQGATLRALGGNASSRALLILDGVPQTDPFGGWISWPAYDPRRLGGVRVVRGGGSGVNGPGALAGTIELTGAGPDELAGFNGSAAYGSRNGVDAYAGLGTALGQGFVSLSGSFARGDGFIPVAEEQRGPVDRPSPYEQASVMFRGIAPAGKDLELQLGGLLFSDKRERGTAFSDIRTEGADASLRIVGSGPWAWSALGYIQARDFYNSFASVNAGRTSATQASVQYSVPSTGIGARFELRPPVGNGLELRIGGDWRETEGETKERFSAGTRRRLAGGRSGTFGAFAEASLERDALTLTAGARLDRWRIRDGFLEESIIATGAPLTNVRHPDRSGWEPTGRAGAAYRFSDRLTVRSAAYLGWRLPTLNELYRPFRVGADATAANPALEPERLRGLEGGAEYRPAPNARFGITLFDNRLEQGIANVTLGRGPGVFPGVGFVAAGGEYRMRRNIDAIHSRGVEVDGRFDFGAWSLSGGYSFADSEVRASGAALPLDRRRPAQTPRHSFATTLAWRGEAGAGGSLGARYTGSQFEDDLNEQRLPNALTFDASGLLPLVRNIALEARAENLTDERVVAGITGAGIIERATPRTFWIGFRLGNSPPHAR